MLTYLDYSTINKQSPRLFRDRPENHLWRYVAGEKEVSGMTATPIVVTATTLYEWLLKNPEFVNRFGIGFSRFAGLPDLGPSICRAISLWDINNDGDSIWWMWISQFSEDSLIRLVVGHRSKMLGGKVLVVSRGLKDDTEFLAELRMSPEQIKDGLCDFLRRTAGAHLKFAETRCYWNNDHEEEINSRLILWKECHQAIAAIGRLPFWQQ